MAPLGSTAQEPLVADVAVPQVLNRHWGKIPPGAVYIGRGTPWGNRFEIGRDGDRDSVCDQYEAWRGAQPEFIARVKRELRGKTLVCSCEPARCHGRWLLRVANE